MPGVYDFKKLHSRGEITYRIAEALRKFFSFLDPRRGNSELELHATLSPRESLKSGVQNSVGVTKETYWLLPYDAIL